MESKRIKTMFFLAVVASSHPLFASALGIEDDAARQAMAALADGREGTVVWASRRDAGNWRIYARNFDGTNLRRLSPDDGRQHVGAHISPDGSRVIWLSTIYPTYSQMICRLDMVNVDGTGLRTLVDSAGTVQEFIGVRWLNEDQFAYIGHPDRDGYVYTMSTGQSQKLFTYTHNEHGALPNPQLSHAINGCYTSNPNNTLFSINNPGPSGTLTTLLSGNPWYGCQGHLANDGIHAYRMGDMGGPVMRMLLYETSTTGTQVLGQNNDPRFPANQRYVYFPQYSRCQRFLAIAASPGQHNHFESDYDIFVLPTDPLTMLPTGNAVKYSWGPTQSPNCIDAWPDLWVGEDAPPLVAPPTFDPNGGMFSSPLEVTITTVTTGATIRYTTDGAEPTESSALYTTPILIGATSTVKARAYKTGYRPSAVATARFTIAAKIAEHKINVGSNTVPGWEQCWAYRTGGVFWDEWLAQPVDWNNQPDPAPEDVYRSIVHSHYSSMSFAIPVASDTNLVRMHFFDALTIFERRMNWSFEGLERISNLNIVNLAGGANKALILELEVEVEDGVLNIFGDANGQDVFVSGIEVIAYGDLAACAEGEITGPCICGGSQHHSGYCCGDSWQSTPCGGDPDAGPGDDGSPADSGPADDGFPADAGEDDGTLVVFGGCGCAGHAAGSRPGIAFLLVALVLGWLAGRVRVLVAKIL